MPLKPLSAIHRPHDCTARKALSTWLAGDYRCGDEPALIRAIRHGTGTRLPDLEIKDRVYGAWERAATASEILAELQSATRAADVVAAG